MKPGQPVPLQTFIHAARLAGREAFLRAQPGHLLVIQVPTGAEEDQVVTYSDARLTVSTALAVAPVAKREGANGFPGMITLGRTANNDVWLASPDISKFHAYFVAQGAAGMSLVDAGSVAGTFYGQQRLEQNARIPLHSGAELRFGTLAATFVSSADFYDLRVG